MKFNWGHGILVALVSFIIFIVGLVVYFTQTMQNSELITDNYYQEELMYQQVIDAKNRAAALEEIPSVQLQSSGIEISFPEDINNDNAHFSFYLYRTDDKNLDVQQKFQLNANRYTIPSAVLRRGSYTLKLSWDKGGESYQVDYDIQWK